MDRRDEAMAKKKKETVLETSSETKASKTLTMDNGAVYEIVSEDGKYYYCGTTRFRKSNPHITKVEG